jgi:hypothetical protein
MLTARDFSNSVLVVSLGRVIALAKLGPDAFDGDATCELPTLLDLSLL